MAGLGALLGGYGSDEDEYMEQQQGELGCTAAWWCCALNRQVECGVTCFLRFCMCLQARHPCKCAAIYLLAVLLACWKHMCSVTHQQGGLGASCMQ
jgi:hypothetical protein